jgi:hypothetical protein
VETKKLKVQKWQKLNLKSMDLILCSGKAGLSKHIQRFQRLTGAPKDAAKLSHVGGIDKVALNAPLQLQESTTLNKFAGKKGVQRNDFGLWLDNYGGRVWARQLDFKRTKKFLRKDKEFWELHKDDLYENGIMGGLELFLCGLRLDRIIRKVATNYNPLKTKNPHCTELVAERLKYHGLLSENAASNRLPPWVWFPCEIDKVLSIPVGPAIRIK